ncbi:MAG: bifunctional glutamate N-acetyltransferase/amino-acid acetyltransferase ArgJ [Gammaproteobacteria bacterium]|nr:bifunctional glutamate N-acetyltransferase/amino-acid acetyltransferase ArgJ [Gammaproteobacteria bacterium]
MPVNDAVIPIAGVRIGTTGAGFKRTDRDDLAVFELAPGATTAAVFTRNAFAAAPVIVARRHLAAAMPRCWIVNSGNANAGTGAGGERVAIETCERVAAIFGCRAREVLPFSTGVIGEPLPVAKFDAALPRVAAGVQVDGWMRAARAIMTTDTIPKACSETVRLSGGSVTVTGIAKGAGMIRPDMATMLAFLATDAGAPPGVLGDALREAVDATFNCITIDGDTSTNDACVLAATGATGVQVDTRDSADGRIFVAALTRVCEHLAQAIVRDGEGATKFVTVAVSGGADAAECRAVAYAVAQSPLVKTALFASDPNWGRIIAAIGRAGVDALDPGGISVAIGGIPVLRAGVRVPDYVEAPVTAVMRERDIVLCIDLGRGAASARVWTCDFSYDYVRINAQYRS